MVDPNIAMGYQGLQLTDPMEQAGKAMSLRHMAMQGQMYQAHAEKLQQEGQRATLKNMIATQSGGDITKLRAGYLNYGLHDEASALDEQQAKADQAKANLQKTNIDNSGAQLKQASDIAGFISDGGTLEHVKMGVQMFAQMGRPEWGQHLMEAASQNPGATPDQVKGFIKTTTLPFIASQLTPEQRLMPKMQGAGGTLTNTNPFATAPDIPITQSEDSIASNAQSERNQGRIDARAKDANNLKQQEVGILGGKQAFEAEHKLADDHKTESKTFIDLRDGYTRIKASLGNATKSAAATLAGATSFMKLLDPGSVVRESELGMALAASGVFDRATNYHNTLMRGKVLTESQAADFKKIAGQIYTAAEENQKKLDKQYTDRAVGYGLKPENVIKDYTANTSSTQTQFKSMPPPADHSGRRIKSDDGTIYKSNGKSWVRE